MDDYERALSKAYCLSIQGKALLLCNKVFNPDIHKYGRAGLIQSDYRGDEATLDKTVVDYLGNWDYSPNSTYQSISTGEEFEDHLVILEHYLKEYEELTGKIHPVDDLVLLLHGSTKHLVFNDTRRKDTPKAASVPFTLVPFVASQATEVGRILRSRNIKPNLDFLDAL